MCAWWGADARVYRIPDIPEADQGDVEVIGAHVPVRHARTIERMARAADTSKAAIIRAILRDALDHKPLRGDK